MIRKISSYLFRIWFYLISGTVLLLLTPLFLLFTSNKNWFPKTYILMKIWAFSLMYGCGYFPKRKGELKFDKNKQYIIVANHMSEFDIILLLATCKYPFLFVGKASLAKIPLFGMLYKRTSILVDRASIRSKFGVYEQVADQIKRNYSVCIFPEQRTSDEDVVLYNFKTGPFKMAIRHNISVLPVVIYDCKRKYPWEVKHGIGIGALRYKVLPSINAKDYAITEGIKMKELAHKMIEKELMEDKTFMKSMAEFKKRN